jgi:hypothetical protein
MPEKLEQPMLTLPLATQLVMPFLMPTAESETAAIESCLRGFNGNRAFLAVLRKLDEEITAVIYQERASCRGRAFPE